MAEIIYSYVSIEKNKDPELDVKQAINKFMETNEFIKLSTGALHDEWFSELKKNEYLDKDTGNKIPDETIKLLEIQKDMTIKNLIKIPKLYETEIILSSKRQIERNNFYGVCVKVMNCGVKKLGNQSSYY